MSGENTLAAWELLGGIYFSQQDDQSNKIMPFETKVTGQGRYPVVLGSAAGVVVAWKRRANLQWQIFDLDGNRVGTINSIKTSQPGRRPSGTVLKDGRFLLFP